MKPIIVIIISFFFLLCCSNNEKSDCGTTDKNKVYYFIFEEPWSYNEYQSTIWYTYRYPADSAEIRAKREIIQNIRNRDTSFAKNSLFLDTVEFSGPTFEFVHKIGRDTVFVKSASILDSTEYYDTTFFKDVERVGKFFGKHFSPKPDTLEIYVIEKIKSSDSVIFRRVNRYTMPWL